MPEEVPEADEATCAVCSAKTRGRRPVSGEGVQSTIACCPGHDGMFYVSRTFTGMAQVNWMPFRR